MNSEELEQSLRTEFEDYLKRVFADVQQEISALQGKVEQEFERHKSQMSEAFADFSARAAAAQTDNKLDAGFRESVVEHLRLARDEGARITATAIAEAEDMEREAAATSSAAASAAVPSSSSVGVSELRDAINDICSQNSQAAILKSLVSHAGNLTPRGAFFIVKNEHLVGWRVFGREEQSNPDAVREIFFPVSSQSTLGESIKSLKAVESTFGVYADDSVFLDKLEFGEPDKMVAIPLVARGRGVAVLYADRGESGEEVSLEALETLVRVAGLTVEVLAAAAPGAKQAQAAEQPQQPTSEIESQPIAVAEPEPETSEEKTFDESGEYQFADDEQTVQTEQTAETELPVSYEQSDETAVDADYQSEIVDGDYADESKYQPENAEVESVSNDYPIVDYTVEDAASDTAEMPLQAEEEFQPVYQDEQGEPEHFSWSQPAETMTTDAAYDDSSPAIAVEPESEAVETESYTKSYSDDAAANQYQFEDEKPHESSESQFESSLPQQQPADETVGSYQNFESAQFDSSSFQTPNNGGAAELTPAISTGSNFNVETVETAAPQTATPKPTRSRFSDRNIDLPVEVTEDERRLHNDARRFARLLVSEIKLYNEQKVKEGRGSNDLYERLREAIDRSREMYDKRVQPPVADKFDYFHYELVNSLAEGDEVKLGESYVGATV